MSASLIDGKAVAALRREELKQRVFEHIQLGHRAPGLAVILIGNDPASTVYVNNKRKACAEVGISSHSYDLSADTSQEALIKLIEELNSSDEIDGILIQLPLPKQITESVILEHIK
ncbi:MAG: bifunctional methylenetetrahydrofolate dehydrogenase/methenyltetrahydrofolate cyclohydrolase, partial [Legionella longbeachae]|nr:bifunctional methylenetetrahydrofolate dehydrogenase/methenyltetrahydrofolate cyclohydrolase [Legionella longbeachae]